MGGTILIDAGSLLSVLSTILCPPTDPPIPEVTTWSTVSGRLACSLFSAHTGSRVVADLKARGVTSLDAAVASHAHADHIGGYQAVLSQFSVGTFYDSGYPSTSSIYENLLTTIDQKNIRFITPTAGQTIDLDPSVIMGAYEVVSPLFEATDPIFTAPAFLPGEFFPMRVKVKLLLELSEPVPFKPLVPALSFIKNKVMWSGSIRGAMRTIPEEDYQRIIVAGEGN